MGLDVRMEASWLMFRPYRWLVERSKKTTHRKGMQREFTRALVLNLSLGRQAVLTHRIGEV